MTIATAAKPTTERGNSKPKTTDSKTDIPQAIEVAPREMTRDELEAKRMADLAPKPPSFNGTPEMQRARGNSRPKRAGGSLSELPVPVFKDSRASAIANRQIRIEQAMVVLAEAMDEMLGSTDTSERVGRAFYAPLTVYDEAASPQKGV